MTRAVAVATAGLLFAVSGLWAIAPDSVPPLTTRVEMAGIELQIDVSGTAPENNDWLGVSFFKPNCQDAVWDAQHSAYLMPKGDFTKTLVVPKEFEGGTFEIALWQKKVAQRPVFRMGTLHGYGSGSVKDSVYGFAANDTVSALKTSVDKREKKLTLKIAGVVRDSADWLGISFYRANYADPVLDADHTVRRVKQGSFIEMIRVPDGFESGTYEVALWKNQLERKDLYKFDKLLGYATGASVQP